MKRKGFSPYSSLRQRVMKFVLSALGIAMSIGLLQINAFSLNLSEGDLAHWLPYIVLFFVFSLLCFVVVFELWRPFRRQKEAIKVLRKYVSMDTLLSHYKNRTVAVNNPVVLSLLEMHVESLPGDFPKDLYYRWTMEGTNTSDGPISMLEFTVAGDSPAESSALNAISKTECVSGILSATPFFVKDSDRVKRLQLPFQGRGPDTGNHFKCSLTYTWPKVLERPCDYFFFETSNYGHIVNHVDIAINISSLDFTSLYIYRINMYTGASQFVGSSLVGENGFFDAYIKKPSNENIYVFLLVGKP